MKRNLWEVGRKKEGKRGRCRVLLLCNRGVVGVWMLGCRMNSNCISRFIALLSYSALIFYFVLFYLESSFGICSSYRIYELRICSRLQYRR